MGISYSGGSSDVVTEEINELFREAYIAYDTIKKIFSPSVDEERENGAIRFVEYCYMWVENLEDRDVIEEEVNAYYKSQNPVEPHHVGYESHLFEGYLEYIEFLGILGTAIGVLIWCWAFVSILLVTIKDVGQRMQEYAVLKSVGYMSKQIYKILAVELSILTGGSLTFSVILTGIAIKIGNYYVKNNMNPFWQTLKFRLSVQSITGCVVLIVITTTVVLTLAVRKIKTMCVIKELKG